MEKDSTAKEYRKLYLFARRQQMSLIQFGILMALKEGPMNMVDLTMACAASDSSIRNAMKDLIYMEVVRREDFIYHLNIKITQQ